MSYTDTRDQYATRRAGVTTVGIRPGMPATFAYYRDTYAAVVTHVTAKTVTVTKVETGPARPDERCDAGAYGVRPMMSDGILDKIIPGTEIRFTLRPNGRWMHGDSTRVVSFDYSRDWRDWRD